MIENGAPVVSAVMAAAIVVALYATGWSATMLAAFALDLALVLAAVVVLLCLPLVGRAGRWMSRVLMGVAMP